MDCYNAENKKAFIESYIVRRVVARTSLTGLFNKIKPFEDRYEKDCSLFDRAQALEMYKLFGAKSVEVLANYNTYLRNYTDFMAHQQQGEQDNVYYGINKDALKACLDPKILSQKYFSREQLDDIEDELLNYTDKAIVEALWHGIGGDSMCDLVSLERKMLNAKKDILILNDGRKISISPKFAEFLDKAFAETEYICYGRTFRIAQLFGFDSLYKERANACAAPSPDVSFRWVYRKILKYKEYLGIPMMTMKTIQASGLLHMLTAEMRKTNCSMRQFLSTNKGKELAMQYGYDEGHYIDVIANKFNGNEEQT